MLIRLVAKVIFHYHRDTEAQRGKAATETKFKVQSSKLPVVRCQLSVAG